jgi:hypothetical protein
MTIRRPIVLIDSTLKTLPTGDTIEGATTDSSGDNIIVASIAQLKNYSINQLDDGYLSIVVSDGQSRPATFVYDSTYDPGSSDDLNIVKPNDIPTEGDPGRWRRTPEITFGSNAPFGLVGRNSSGGITHSADDEIGLQLSNVDDVPAGPGTDAISPPLRLSAQGSSGPSYSDFDIRNSPLVNVGRLIGRHRYNGGSWTDAFTITSAGLLQITEVKGSGDLKLSTNANGDDLEFYLNATRVAYFENITASSTETRLVAPSGQAGIVIRANADVGQYVALRSGTSGAIHLDAPTINLRTAGSTQRLSITTGTSMAVSLDGTVTAFSLDGAATISIGTTSATSITLSRSGQTTTIAGNASVSGTLGVTGTTTLTGSLIANGDTTIGNATSDTLTVTARLASTIEPSTDNNNNLGSSSLRMSGINARQLIARADNSDSTKMTITGSAMTHAGGTTYTITPSLDLLIQGNFRYERNIGVESAGTVPIDFGDGNIWDITLTASGWDLTFDGMSDGTIGILIIRQDATGRRTLGDWSINAIFPENQYPILSKEPNSYDIFIGFVNGGNIEFNQKIDTATLTGVQTADFDAIYGDVVECDPSGAGFAVNLPSATGYAGRGLLVVNTTNSTNTITINADGSDTIDGVSAYTITTSRGRASFVSNGSNGFYAFPPQNV